MSYLESFQILKIIHKKLDFCREMYYLYYVINDKRYGTDRCAWYEC